MTVTYSRIPHSDLYDCTCTCIHVHVGGGHGSRCAFIDLHATTMNIQHALTTTTIFAAMLYIASKLSACFLLARALRCLCLRKYMQPIFIVGFAFIAVRSITHARPLRNKALSTLTGAALTCFLCTRTWEEPHRLQEWPSSA